MLQAAPAAPSILERYATSVPCRYRYIVVMQSDDASQGTTTSSRTFHDHNYVMPRASGSQIHLHTVRAEQRDSSQINRLIALTSDLIRSFAGSRWLLRKEAILSVLVKAIYLLLTFGRGSQTLGEEYTDLMPTARNRTPITVRRRLLTILFLLAPSLLTSPASISAIRGRTEFSNSNSEKRFARFRGMTADCLESTWCRALPELHMAAFMFGGRFLEMGKRLTGVSYISMSPELQIPSYEPLGVLLLISFCLRRLQQSRQETDLNGTAVPERVISIEDESIHPPTIKLREGPPVKPLDKIPNTYLTEEARMLPERKCSLCFEPRGTGDDSQGTTAVTECGHVFCWGCLGGLEKLECPLCRQTLRMERLVAAYNL